MGRACNTQEGDENEYKFFVEKYEVNKQLARPRLRCEDNIKMDLKERQVECQLD
jgi:hypothetical protein